MDPGRDSGPTNEQGSNDEAQSLTFQRLGHRRGVPDSRRLQLGGHRDAREHGREHLRDELSDQLGDVE